MGMDFNSFSPGDPYRKLDLWPEESYESEIKALDDLLAGEYDTVVEAARDLRPRTSHELFRQAYGRDEPVEVDQEHVEQIQEVLGENADNSRTPIGEKLFELGYSWRDPPMDYDRAMNRPYLNHGQESDLRQGVVPNPVRQGMEKRESDRYYVLATGYLLKDMRDNDLTVE
jgi:hypothetical protein